MEHLIRPQRDSAHLLDVTPESAGWKYLSFSVVRLQPGKTYDLQTGTNEIAIVPLAGEAVVTAAGQSYALSRKGCFEEVPQVFYAPPRTDVCVTAQSAIEFAIGGAPAKGKYPVRLFLPTEMKQEIRGGGVAIRQVSHILAPPMPAERLILFEVYVPSGSYSGWPPHCHDGYGGSPYLEEVYYFRLFPESGYCTHRNYRRDHTFEEIFVARDRDLVLVTEGFHTTAVPPGSNIYFLNYLAGDLLDEKRATPPYDDPDWGWMKQNYEGNKMALPLFGIDG